MTKDEIIKALRDMAKYPTVTLPRDCEALRMAADLLAQSEQPKVRTGNCLRVGVCASEGHKIAPQRTWVGLTEKDILEAAVNSQDGISPREDTLRFAVAIEAKLKEKNT